MRVISWNINSVRARLPRLLALLHRHEPDIVCLQETKVHNYGGFPFMALNTAGYSAILHGQHNFNGVATLIHNPARKYDLFSFGNGPPIQKEINIGKLGDPTDICYNFPGDPSPEHARVLSICIGGLRLVNVYVVNGKQRGHEQFDLKRRWMAALGKWLKNLPNKQPILIVGDFNVAPDDRDVWDPIGLKDRIHCTIEERSWLNELKGEKFFDILRKVTKKRGVYTWWPYQRNAFERNEGLRFDLALGDSNLVKMVKRVWVDKDERRVINGLVKPSDHAPLVIDLFDKSEQTENGEKCFE